MIPSSAEAPTTEAPRERDLGAELGEAVGSIQACLDLETARRIDGTLRVPITAQVLPSGRISRASARGGSLSREQNQCIEGVVTHTSLRGPIDGAPREVSTTLELDVEITEGTPGETSTTEWTVTMGGLPEE